MPEEEPFHVSLALLWDYNPLVVSEGHVPLQSLVAFEFVLEAELVVLVGEFEEV